MSSNEFHHVASSTQLINQQKLEVEQQPKKPLTTTLSSHTPNEISIRPVDKSQHHKSSLSIKRLNLANGKPALTNTVKNGVNSVSRSSFKLHKYLHQDSLDDKHEITFRFKKNRSLSHSYTTGYDIYDEDNDEKKIVSDEEDEQEEEEEMCEESENEIAEQEEEQDENNNVSKVNSNKNEVKIISNQSNSLNVNEPESTATTHSSTDNSSTSTSSSSEISAKIANGTRVYVTEYIKTSDPDLNMMIVDDSESVMGETTASKKRVDSIRMRHYSTSHTGHTSVKMSEPKEVGESVGRARLFRVWKRNNSAKQKRHNYLVIFLLFVVNLLNYIDRYTLAGN
jgi:hypothetical protein